MAYPNNHAIVTAYHGPTNSRGSRIEATCQDGRHSNAYDAELSAMGNHEKAARDLADYMGFSGDPMGAPHPNKKDYVWIFPRGRN